VNEAICNEVWSRAVSSPRASLKPDTLRSALTLWQPAQITESNQSKLLLLLLLLLLVTNMQVS
jgi:hypothetical protein